MLHRPLRRDILLSRAVFAALIVALMIAAGCGGSGGEPATFVVSTTTTTSTEPAPQTSTPAELEIVGFGPYEVGVQTITIGASGDRPLTVDVWFPLSDEAIGDPQQYTFLPGVYYESPNALASDPAQLATSDVPFPLVIYSHGSGGLRYIHSNFTETIASHGYIVAAADHTGNTTLEIITQAGTSTAETALNRPNDVTTLIDGMLDESDEAAGAFAASIDGDQIAVTGHSFGGFTSFATVSGYDNELGSYASDDRVDALVVLAPLAVEELLSDERLAAVDVPVMMIVGSDDKTTPIDPNVTRPWDLVANDSTYRVELAAAEHQTFTDVCDYLDFLPTLEAVPEIITTTIDDFAESGCAPGDMPIDRAQELTNTFAVTFLDQVFRNGEPIDPETSTIPDDVVYLTR